MTPFKMVAAIYSVLLVCPLLEYVGLKPNIFSLLCSLYYFVINLFSRSDVFDFSVNVRDIVKALYHAVLNKDVIPVIGLNFISR
ncbi:hypothetical protein C5S35_01605 [Candidatus Methanophagaceae archaeon]|jgi:hypothetical protein|nr:hypothetical protein C5S35_01605 [Methanophagales archaeon]